MTTTEIDVSVVIPTRSRWHLLSRAALPAALAQHGVRHEVIVVGGSTDETPQRLDELEDARVVVIRHDSSRGVARARNAGSAAARGRWVSFLDDDVWAPGKLEAQLDAADRARAVLAYAAGAELNANRMYLFAVAPPDPNTLTRELLHWNVIWCGCSNVVARTDLVRQLGGFDEQLFQLADWDLRIRLALAGRAAVAHDVLVGYVMRDESMLLTDRRDVFLELDYLAAKHRAAHEAHGVELDHALLAVGRSRPQGSRDAPARRRAPPPWRSPPRRPGAALRAFAAVMPEALFKLGSRLATNDRRFPQQKLSLPEPDWIERLQP